MEKRNKPEKIEKEIKRDKKRIIGEELWKSDTFARQPTIQASTW
jgi:hypothetical protein